MTWIYFSFIGQKPLSQRDGILESSGRINIDAKNENTDGKISTDYRLPANAAKNLKMLFFGDLMLDRHVKEKIAKYGFNYLLTKLDTDGVFDERDIIGANLEGAVTNGGAHYPPANIYDFAFAPELLSNLKKYNFNFFNLANNHLADQGERGIIETRSNLLESGFDFSGCVDGEVGECSQKIIAKNGLKIGLVGLSMIYSQFNAGEATKIISALSTSTDLVIVNIHWGEEYEHNFSRLQQEMAHELVAAGADIIIGHHPHVVQGLEVYRTKRATANGAQAKVEVMRPIFYSLGNFIFDQYFSPDAQEELVVSINWTPKKMEITMLPMRSVGSQPYLLEGEEKEKFLEKFAGWSEIDNNLKQQIKTGEINL